MTQDKTVPPPEHGRFAPGMVYRAARMYYLEDANQAQIAAQLGTSRPTVSRLLAEARATGVVRIQVVDPEEHSTADLEAELRATLGLRAAYVAPSAAGVPVGRLLAEPAGHALSAAGLVPGDALLVSSGVTVHAVVQQHLPDLRGVLVYPTSGGVDEPESAYQTNEITRALALKVSGTPVMLYAPAVPGPALREALMEDDHTVRVMEAWHTARAALLGVGASLADRSLIPSVFSVAGPERSAIVGDMCMRPFDAGGDPVVIPGIERLVSMELADLRRLEHSIALAVGEAKVAPLLAAAGAGYYNTLVTDSDTAVALLAAARAEP
ncbi:sugar-binding transcriptional regulator [Arsenicicoccus sp. oral taxon 190]|uniref:sugar-binding transcriptional regulator n=1 Tax=Arsenicicoccus sp. oral taxon 190 TaxID=1658671 RepID=UPI00067B2277|nr:sugar-binding domain-containing protein [Arsenicicoccus sp. oral taxon 190]